MMLRLFRVMLLDLVGLLKTIFSGLLCFSSLIVFTALAFYVTFFALNQPQTGVSYFYEIMDFNLVGLTPGIKEFVRVLNWICLIMMAGVVIKLIKDYIDTRILKFS